MKSFGFITSHPLRLKSLRDQFLIHFCSLCILIINFVIRPLVCPIAVLTVRFCRLLHISDLKSPTSSFFPPRIVFFNFFLHVVFLQTFQYAAAWPVHGVLKFSRVTHPTQVTPLASCWSKNQTQNSCLCIPGIKGFTHLQASSGLHPQGSWHVPLWAHYARSRSAGIL